MQIAVCIPIYKARPSRSEIISLKQCIKILKNHPIIFVVPQTIEFDEYLGICKDIDYEVVKFKDEYFQNIAGYNKLMLSANFYKKFLKYKYILIYQLDAFVFKDELLYWCSMNYDFIGAPHTPAANAPGEMQFLKNYSRVWTYINNVFYTNHTISNVGNGGLSLRKTVSFYYLLKLLKNKIDAWDGLNEDGFFKYWGNIFYPFFRLPKDEIALKFSIETSPAESLKKLGGVLPFGCHAFEKYEWETWKPFITDDN